MIKRLFIFIVNIGVDGLDERQKNIIRGVNLMSIISTIVSMMYEVFYITLGASIPIVLNMFAPLSYLTTLYFSHIRRHNFAKFWIFTTYLIHLFLLTQVVFTKETGFHYYYLLMPFLVFLVFDYSEIWPKLFIIAVSVFLFYFIEIGANPYPYIHLPAGLNRILYLTSILIAFTCGGVVVFISSFYINVYEHQQRSLIESLRNALSEVKTLKGFLPICSGCKKIRDDKGYWNQIESYIQERSEAEFSHGICPDCKEKLYGKEEWYIEVKNKKKLEDNV